MTISKGSKVYRVVDVIAFGGTSDERCVEEREVKIVRSDASVILVRSFTGMVRKQYGKEALGLYFFLTPEDAVRDFAARQRRNIENAQRMVDAADRALKWAEIWGQQYVIGLKLVEED